MKNFIHKWLGKVVRDVSFGNAKRYFGLDV